MDKLNQVKNMLEFIDKIINQEFKDVKEILSFIPAFIDLYLKEEAKLPYHINLMSEIGADENAHSRILAKLLQQKTSCDKFEILESFVQYIKEKAKRKSASFENIHIKNPVITQEKKRIDLWIRDNKDYAIIVENKIHRANDTEEQLSRYIDRTKDEGFREEQIFIIYLSPTYDKEPDKQTWGEYKETFAERYINLSFREDILEWLTDSVLPNVRLKEKYLSSTLEQYIDYLEEMFNLRNINQKMNMELRDLIKQEWELKGSLQENVSKLLAKQKEIKKISDQVDSMIKDFDKEIFQEWKGYLEVEYRDYEQITTCLGLIIPIQNTEVRVIVSNENKRLFCQVDMDHLPDKKDRILPKEVVEKVGYLLDETHKNEVTDKSQIWKFFPCLYSYDEAFRLMLKVIQILTNK